MGKADTLEGPGGRGKMQKRAPRILTNMRFHESAAWQAAVTSMYPDHGRDASPLSAWAEARTLWRQAPGFDAVVTMGARESLLYGLLCLLTGRPSRQIFSEIFLDRPRPNQPFWRAKEALFRAVAARSLGLLASSRHEQVAQAARLGLPAHRALFVPLNANAIEPAPASAPEPFLVAAGRSWRDYPTLLAALADPPVPAHLFIGADDLPGLRPPPHVTLHREVPREQYLDYLRRCAFVVIPLVATERATGQVVLLEAMSLGKAVIATRAPGTVDYMEDGVTGLFVEPGDPTALRGAIRRLWTDPALRDRLAAAGQTSVAARFSIAAHTQAKLAAIAHLLGGADPLAH